MDSSDEDIWDYKSLSRRSQVGGSKSSLETKENSSSTSNRQTRLQNRKSVLSQPIAKRSSTNTKLSTQIVSKEPVKRSSTTSTFSRKSTQVKQEPGSGAKRSSQTSKRRNTQSKKCPVVKTGCGTTPAKRVGRCPICQVPYSALSAIQTPSWHLDECQMCTDEAEDECSAGLSCTNMIESHYRRYRHTEIARSCKKELLQSSQQYGNVEGAKTCLKFDKKVLNPTMSHLMSEPVIEISSGTDDDGKNDVEDKEQCSSSKNSNSDDDCFENLDSESVPDEILHPIERTPVANRHKDLSNDLPMHADSSLVAYRESFENLVQNSLVSSIQDIDEFPDDETRNVSDMLQDVVGGDSPSDVDDVVQPGKTNVFEDIFSSDTDRSVPSSQNKKEGMVDYLERESVQSKSLKPVKNCLKSSDRMSVYSVDTVVDEGNSETSDMNNDDLVNRSGICGRGDACSKKQQQCCVENEKYRMVKKEQGKNVNDFPKKIKAEIPSENADVYCDDVDSENDNKDKLSHVRSWCRDLKRSYSSDNSSSSGELNLNPFQTRAPESKLENFSNKGVHLSTAVKKENESVKKIGGSKNKQKEIQRNSKAARLKSPKPPKKKALQKVKEEISEKKQKSVKSFFLSKAVKKEEIVIKTDSESEDENCIGNHTKPNCCMQCRAVSSQVTPPKQIKVEKKSVTNKGDLFPRASTSYDPSHVGESRENYPVQDRDEKEIDTDGARDMLEEDTDNLPGGFFTNGDMENELGNDSANGYCENSTTSVASEANSFNQTSSMDSCSADCSRDTISFVQTVSEKVTQITRNAADILMASSKFLYQKGSQQLQNSDMKPGQWGFGGNRGRNMPGSNQLSFRRDQGQGRGSVGGAAAERSITSAPDNEGVGSETGREYEKRKCPFYKKIPDTCFTVDAFRYGEIPGCRAYILSHFHYDHYGGLTKKFSQPIYCSQITANLVKQKIKVDSQYLHPIPLDTPTVVENVQITLLEANHCPGAVLILFRLRNGKVFLHTGDFRANTAMELYPALRNIRINTLYLDTTYCDPQYSFPPQEEAIAFAVKLAEESVARNPKTLIVCGTYTIGKERIFAAIASVLNCKICVTRDKKSVLDCLEDEELQRRISLRWEDSCLHVLPMNKMNHKGLLEHLTRNARMFDSVLGIEPTGWTFSKNLTSLDQIRPKVNKDNIKVYGVPYSEHSSFLELKRFVQFTKPGKTLPTVNNGNVHSRRRMEVIFEAWREETSHS